MSTFCVRPEIHHVDPEIVGDVAYQCPCCGNEIVPVDFSDRKGAWCHKNQDAICAEGDELESPCFFVEFAVLFDDHTWDTEVAELPSYYGHDRCTSDDLVEWAHAVLAKDYLAQNVVQFSVYNTNAD